MLQGSHGERRPADVIGNAITVAKIATGEAKDVPAPGDDKDAAAMAMGRKGGAARARQ